MLNCLRCQKTLVDPFHGLHKTCFYEWFNMKEDEEFKDVLLLKEQNKEKQKTYNTSFFQGKFKKYSAQLGKKNFILKVMDEDYPELPFLEYCSNQIAKQIGINVPPFFVIRFLNEIETFVVHNFMDDFKSSNLIHIYHFIKEGDDYSVQTLLEIISTKVGRLDAIQQFIGMCLFDALIGNHDRHGRNIGLIQNAKGFALAPFYDNPSYIGIENYALLLADLNPRGKIETSISRTPTMKDYILEFKSLGYDDFVLPFYKKIQKIDFDCLINSSFLSEKRKQSFKNLILKRKKEMEDVLSI